MSRAGFTLLEVMVAVAILGLALTAIFSSEVGAVHIATRARDQNVAALLARCKMGEVEEIIAVEGLPAIEKTSENKSCCEDADVDGFECDWIIERIVLPELGFEEELEDAEDALGEEADEAARGPDRDETLNNVRDQVGSAEDYVSGQSGGNLTSLAMQLAYPVIKPSLEEQVRRVTVSIRWSEGSAERGFDLIQYLVAEQPPPGEEGAQEENDEGDDS